MNAPDDASGDTVPRWRILLTLVIPIVAAAGAAVLLLPVTSRTTGRVGPGTVAVSVSLSDRGHTELALPPLGRVTADTHRAPTALLLRLEELDVTDMTALRRLGDDFGVPDRDKLIETVSDELPGLIRAMALRTAWGSALVGAGAALLLLRGSRLTLTRRALLVAGGAVVAPATALLLAGSTAWGYRPEAFEAPRLSGQLAFAGSFLQQSGQQLSTSLDRIDERTRVLSARIADLYSSAVTSQVRGATGDTVILHISDIHLNPIGLSLARQIATSFDVDAVLDTGDLTSFGEGPEAKLVGQITSFDVPYLFVAGNHDGAEARTAIAALDGVEAIDGRAVKIGSVTILGVDDPTYTALRSTDPDDLRRTYRRQQPRIQRLIRETQPDLLAVHNPLQADAALGSVRAVAAGHLHRFRLTRTDGTVMAVVGSSGAAGLEALLAESTQPYGFELLRFEDGRLVAVDTIELQGTSGDFESRRRLLTDDHNLDPRPARPEPLVLEPSLEDLATTTTARQRTSTTTAPDAATTTTVHR